MIWKKFPHMAEENEKIMVEYTQIKGRFYPITVTSFQQWAHINRWCFKEDWEKAHARQIKEKA